MGSIQRMAMLVLNLLILGSFVSGNLLFPRQSTTSSSALPSQSSSPIPEENDPNRPSLVTSTDVSSNNTTNPTSSSLLPSGTSTANSTNTTNSTDLNPTVTSNPTPLNNTNDPGACHKDFDSSQGVFPGPLCHPAPGDLIPTNTTYRMTWDPNLFPQDANITITLFRANHTTIATKQIEDAFYSTPDTQPTLQGHAWIEVPTSLLNGSAGENVTVVLFREGSELGGPDGSGRYVGPEVVLFDPAKGNGTSLASNNGNNTTSSSGTSGGSSKKLGEEVGIPIGLIFFLALFGVAIFFILRRRKATGGDYLARRKSRTGSARGAGAGGLVGPHRRTERFHDEPTMGGGVELQNTSTRGSRACSGASSVSRLSEGDSWGWGSPGGGGVSTTVTGGEGNVFREELGRQQTGRGY